MRGKREGWRETERRGRNIHDRKHIRTHTHNTHTTHTHTRTHTHTHTTPVRKHANSKKEKGAPRAEIATTKKHHTLTSQGSAARGLGTRMQVTFRKLAAN